MSGAAPPGPPGVGLAGPGQGGAAGHAPSGAAPGSGWAPGPSALALALSERRFSVTGELEPGRTTDLSELLASARSLKGSVVACNVTDNPQSMGCMSSLAASYLIERETGLETVYQLRCADRNRLALQSDLLGAWALGIRNVLAITGDHPALGDQPGAMPVFDLDAARLARMATRLAEGFDLEDHPVQAPPRFLVGVAANPNADPLEPEVLKLARKQEAGARFVQTQVVFDIRRVERFLDAARDAGVGIPVLVGVLPLRSLGAAEAFDRCVPGVSVPPELIGRLRDAASLPKERRRAAYEGVNLEFFGELLAEVRRSRAAGAHVMAVGYEGIVPRLVASAVP